MPLDHWGDLAMDDPMDFFLWDEFFNPGTQYECPDCGSRFGPDCVAWSEEEGIHIYECPGCGCSGIVE
jgi:hypothetical protein